MHPKYKSNNIGLRNYRYPWFPYKKGRVYFLGVVKICLFAIFAVIILQSFIIEKKQPSKKNAPYFCFSVVADSSSKAYYKQIVDSVKYIIETQKCSYILMDIPAIHGMLYNQYVMGNKHVADIERESFFHNATRRYKDPAAQYLQGLMEWIKEYNQNQSEKKRINIIGFDFHQDAPIGPGYLGTVPPYSMTSLPDSIRKYQWDEYCDTDSVLENTRKMIATNKKKLKSILKDDFILWQHHLDGLCSPYVGHKVAHDDDYTRDSVRYEGFLYVNKKFHGKKIVIGNKDFIDKWFPKEKK